MKMAGLFEPKLSVHATDPIVVPRGEIRTLTDHITAAGAERVRMARTIIVEEDARVEIKLIVEAAGTALVEVTDRVIHRGARSVSVQTARAALDGQSSVLVKTAASIEHEATDAEATERIDMLLLSPTADARPVPMLEVHTNRVTSGHAATVGHLDPEKLFYLMSRGLDEKSARRLLVEAFLTI